MRTRTSRVGFLALATLLAGAVACSGERAGSEIDQGQTAQTSPAQPDSAAIKGMQHLGQEFVEAYNRGDAAGVAALFADDGTQAPPLSPALDRAGIEKVLTGMFEASPGVSLAVEPEAMIASGDEAASWGSFTVTFPSEGAEPVVATGRYGTVARRDADGTWKILRHMYNFETPPPGFCK